MCDASAIIEPRRPMKLLEILLFLAVQSAAWAFFAKFFTFAP